MNLSLGDDEAVAEKWANQLLMAVHAVCNAVPYHPAMQKSLLNLSFHLLAERLYHATDKADFASRILSALSGIITEHCPSLTVKYVVHETDKQTVKGA